MKILEFWGHINSDYTLKLPPKVAKLIQQGQPIQVILLIPESGLIPEPGEDQEWTRLTTEQFLKGYTNGDAIYDEL